MSSGGQANRRRWAQTIDDPATGVPEKMEQRSDELTPMLSQYYELASEYSDCLLLFQVGDFYEAFCEAAETASRLLEITLTQREDSTGTYAMAGIPIDNAESYIDSLLDAGYRVAIADQVQDPDETTGVVDRAVTRIITPGTLTEEELLADESNNFVGSVAAIDGAYGLALLDVSTGDFFATTSERASRIKDEIDRFAPAEVITDLEQPPIPEKTLISPHRDRAFDFETAKGRFDAYFGATSPGLITDAEIKACGALLSYAEYTRGAEVATVTEENTNLSTQRLEYINQIRRYDPREYMLLDAAALQSLEIFSSRSVRGVDDATLIEMLDETQTAMGSRKLEEWLRQPLVDTQEILSRQGIVAALVSDVTTREELRRLLQEVYDIERLVSRSARNRANARDLRSLHDTLEVVPKIQSVLAETDSEAVTAFAERIDPVKEITELIDESIRGDPPAEITEGGIIAEGYDETLDELRATKEAGKQWIDELEEKERERTGIDSLKVGYNSVHGYYIEVTDANLDSVPDHYDRRQTLKNAERYITPKLKERETEIVQAEGKADDLEYELFCKIRRKVAERARQLQQLAEELARIDVLANLAEVAAVNDYTRPVIDDGSQIEIQGGRHPIVEQRQQSFVPNDTTLTPDERFMIITGPNMSGKSTYMRQVALIILMAQIGSFVPADQAQIRPINRVFTRVGASDDIAGGRSTFMIEMLEVAEILRHADENSLVLLDEVGRGTSTADGLAIAKAIVSHLHDKTKSLTLFATHHHELTKTASQRSAAKNVHFEAEHTDTGIEFSHELRTGKATGSYGIDVAQKAGVPEEVVEDARQLLERKENEQESTADNQGMPADACTQQIITEIEELEIATMTPIDALTKLASLQETINNQE